MLGSGRATRSPDALVTLCATPAPSRFLHAPPPFLLLPPIHRRYGQELGGNKTGAYGCAAVLVFLWMIYIIMSCLSTYGFVQLKL